jgi:hypothetical protein
MKRQNGFVLVITLLQITLFMLVMSAIAQATLSNFVSSRSDLYSYRALDTAEAGADAALAQINQDNTYTGTNTTCPIGSTGSNPVTLYNDSTRGKGTYENCITTGGITNEKIIYSVGKTYLPNRTAPYKTRTVRFVIEGSVANPYAVQTGPAGLIMSNSATITNGAVKVGGFLTLSNSAQIGSVTQPLQISVGNYRCPQPADNSYPSLCGVSNPNPITINGPQAHIYGSITANGQSNTTNMSNPGLVASSGAGNVALPDYDRTSQKNAVAQTITAAAASCGGNQTLTWPANVKITGNVTISNNCIVTVSGNAWITGSLSTTQKGTIVLANSATTTPTIMVDGSSGISLGNQSQISSNASGVGMQLITFWANAGCSPDCGSLTGPQLSASQGTVTINLGNQGLAAGSTFYSRWSAIALAQSGSIGSVLGQEIILSNTGSISFGGGTGLGGVITYSVRYYEQL